MGYGGVEIIDFTRRSGLLRLANSYDNIEWGPGKIRVFKMSPTIVIQQNQETISLTLSKMLRGPRLGVPNDKPSTFLQQNGERAPYLNPQNQMLKNLNSLKRLQHFKLQFQKFGTHAYVLENALRFLIEICTFLIAMLR